MILDFFNDPVTKRALVGALLVSISGAPLGVILTLRRMSLMGDVIAHALLPGTAAGFILAGASMTAMSLGGLLAGLLVALLAGLATRVTALREDAHLASFYLIAVALGIMMLSLHGTAQELEDVLFGNAEMITPTMLEVMAGVSCASLIVFTFIYRPLVVESFDPVFLKSMRGQGGLYHILFMLLVVTNMVEGYRALGTLMASGLMLIPAVTAQFWTRFLASMIGVAVLIAVICSAVGILIACTLHVPSGAAIILLDGLFYVFSVLFGNYGSLRTRYAPPRHYET